MNELKEYTRIGEMIKGERLKHRISLRDFCRAIKCNSCYVSELERGIIDFSSYDLADISEALKLETAEDRKILYDLSLLTNIVEQPHELMLPFPHGGIKSKSDQIKIIAILNIERLDNKAYQDEIRETLDTFEQQVLFEYFVNKIRDLGHEFKAYKQTHGRVNNA